MTYEIPLEGANHLDIGRWVEIFEAYGQSGASGAIQVKSMRVGGKTLVFGKRERRFSGKALRPHEGEVVLIDQGPQSTTFRIRLNA